MYSKNCDFHPIADDENQTMTTVILEDDQRCVVNENNTTIT